MAVFEYKEKVGILDIRMENLLSNKGVIRILEDVACEASQDVGYGINNMNETDLTWILLSWKIEILKREKFNELLTIKTWTRESSKMFTYRDFEVYNSNNELLIKASTKWAAVSPSQGKLRAITPDILEKYQVENDKKVFPDVEDVKLPVFDEFDNKEVVTIHRNYIDINNHVNNLYYLDIAYEVLPDDVFENYELNNIEIVYKRQMLLNDRINCYYKKKEDGVYVVLKSFDDKITHAILKLY